MRLICIYLHQYLYFNTYIYTRECARIYIRECVRIHEKLICTCIHEYLYISIYVISYIYEHAYMYVYTHTICRLVSFFFDFEDMRRKQLHHGKPLPTPRNKWVISNLCSVLVFFFTMCSSWTPDTKAAKDYIYIIEWNHTRVGVCVCVCVRGKSTLVAHDSFYVHKSFYFLTVRNDGTWLLHMALSEVTLLRKRYRALLRKRIRIPRRCPFL